MKHLLSIALFCTVLCFGMPQGAEAQVAGYNLGIGGQLGDPSGLAVKWYRGGGPGSLNFRAWDFLFAWETGGASSFFVNVHGLFERPVPDIPLNLYYGPGLFVGFIEVNDDDRAYLGISGNFGVSYEIDRFDIFFQLTPRLAVVPDTDGHLGAGLGARFWL